MAPEDAELLNEAIKYREQAYAPYSCFKVGAAVRLASNKIIGGSNQENAAYPSGLCAERVALFAAHAQFPKEKMKALAITCRHTQKETAHPLTSCGGCRQVMLEFEQLQNTPMRVLFYGETGEVWELPNVSCLMPYFFDKNILD